MGAALKPVKAVPQKKIVEKKVVAMNPFELFADPKVLREKEIAEQLAKELAEVEASQEPSKPQEPLKEGKCKYCRGTGEDFEFPGVVCVGCDGTGEKPASKEQKAAEAAAKIAARVAAKDTDAKLEALAKEAAEASAKASATLSAAKVA